MELPNDFAEFLKGIRPTADQSGDLKTGHATLRARLRDDDDLKSIVDTDFLQGSYRRATALRPKGAKKSDVDIVVVTNLSEAKFTPTAAMRLFEPFLDKHYKGKWVPQGRSFGITLSYVELDLVITSAPLLAAEEAKLLKFAAVTDDDGLDEAEDWRLHPAWVPLSERPFRADSRERLIEASTTAEWAASPLRIPDRDANQWQSTHPLEQMRWTRDKNAECNRHFVNIVKAIKWWRLERQPDPTQPKGFPLERLVGECCPDGVTSVAAGITLTFESIVERYKNMVASKTKPRLPDYGVADHDVLKRVTPEQFADFYSDAQTAANVARRALDSNDRSDSGNLWRELLGSKFPTPPGGGGTGKDGGFTPPKGPASPGSGRFA
jgi:hypothetical protein